MLFIFALKLSYQETGTIYLGLNVLSEEKKMKIE